jgi:hypothetical protein
MKISFEDASPARRQYDDGRSLADNYQTLNCAPSEAADFGGFVVGVDDEFSRPPHTLTSCVPTQAC